MRIPQLAMHLDRGVNDEGLRLDKQQHTAPVWSVGHRGLSVLDHLAEVAGCTRAEIDGYDLVAYDTAAPAVFGPHGEFFASGRLDNLSSVHAGLVALLADGGSEHVELLAAFDHEEVGSGSRSGRGRAGAGRRRRPDPRRPWAPPPTSSTAPWPARSASPPTPGTPCTPTTPGGTTPPTSRSSTAARC